MKVKVRLDRLRNLQREITVAKNNTSILLSPEGYKLYIHHKNQMFEVLPVNRNSIGVSTISYEIPEIKHDPDIQACISKIVNQLSNDIDRSNEENNAAQSDNSEEVREEIEEEKEGNQQGEENQQESQHENKEDERGDEENKNRQEEKEEEQAEKTGDEGIENEREKDGSDNTPDPVEELLKDLADVDLDNEELDAKEEEEEPEEEEEIMEEDLEEGKCGETNINLDSFKVVKKLLKKDNKKLKEAIKNILENGENPKEKEGIKKALKNPKNKRVINKLIQEAENELKFELPDNPRNDHNTIYFLNSMPDWIKRYFKGNKHKKEARELEKAFRKLLNDLGLDAYSPRLDAKEVIKRIETARDPSKAYKRELETKKLLLAFDISGSMSAFIPVALPAVKLSATYPNLTVILHTNFGINCIIENGKIKENKDYSKNLEIWKEYIEDTEVFISLSDWDGGSDWVALFEQTKEPPKKTYWLMPFPEEYNYSQSYINKLIKKFKNVELQFDITTVSDYCKFVVKKVGNYRNKG